MLTKSLRILILSDDEELRSFLSDLLGRETEIILFTLVRDARAAERQIARHAPNVVLLDLDVPRLRGLDTLKKVRELHPELPVLLLREWTELTDRGFLKTIGNGRQDVTRRPEPIRNERIARRVVFENLIPRLENLVQEPIRLKPAGSKLTRQRPIEILAIGSSTGGPVALDEVLGCLDPELGVPIVIAQHMPPLFTARLAEQLTRTTPFEATEARTGQALEPGTLYIAPGDHHMEVRWTKAGPILALNQDPPENGCRPAIDPLFRSVAKCFGSRCLAVILTGMGHDGTTGAKAISEAGGQILAQDEASSVVWGMPGSIVHAGLADAVVSSSTMASEIESRIRYSRRQPAGAVTALIR